MTNPSRMVAMLAVLMLSVAACSYKPPRVPYIVVGVYSGTCGFDVNGQAVANDRLASTASSWRGERQLALVFVLGAVPSACVTRAYRTWQNGGFERIWMVRRPPYALNEPALMPPMLD